MAKVKATVVKLSTKSSYGHNMGVQLMPQPTNIPEFDRVLGGGLVPGAVILLAGEPGIGKSTLIGHVASGTAKNTPILISSGEESVNQVRMRMERIKAPLEHISMIEETSVEAIGSAVETLEPSLVIVDSIQTASTVDIDTPPGSPTQIRATTAKLMELAKRTSTPVLIVGQIIKDGSLAGPKLLEHMVDVVLGLEGDQHTAYRILRATKNRFGNTDEVGIFEMTGVGLSSVENPSERFLSERKSGPGSVIACVMEGKRPILVEVQALVDKSSYGYPIRRASGFDANRLQVLIAIMNRHLNAKLEESDVYVNVVGGMAVREPAADLAIIGAILSAKTNQLFQQTILCGEVGLGGEVRTVPFLDRRLKEAERLGLPKAFIPETKTVLTSNISLCRVAHISIMLS